MEHPAKLNAETGEWTITVQVAPSYPMATAARLLGLSRRTLQAHAGKRFECDDRGRVPHDYILERVRQWEREAAARRVREQLLRTLREELK